MSYRVWLYQDALLTIIRFHSWFKDAGDNLFTNQIISSRVTISSCWLLTADTNAECFIRVFQTIPLIFFTHPRSSLSYHTIFNNIDQGSVRASCKAEIFERLQDLPDTMHIFLRCSYNILEKKYQAFVIVTSG